MAKRMKDNLDGDLEPMSELEKYFRDKGIDIDAELKTHKSLGGEHFDDEEDDKDLDNEIVSNDDDNYDIVGGEREGDILPFDDHEHAKEVIKHFLGKLKDDMSEFLDYLEFSDYAQHLAGEEFEKYKKRALKIRGEIMNFLKTN